MRSSGLVLPAREVLLPSSIMRQNVEALPLAASQTNAEKLAAQLNATGADRPYINFLEFTNPLWVVPYGQPEERVTLVKEEGAEETPRSKEVQEAFGEYVPLPLVSEIPKGYVASPGSDSSAIIWQPSTDRLWELHRLHRFAAGPQVGEWKAGAGRRQLKASEWDGIVQVGESSLSASGLSGMAGAMLLSEIEAILRGNADEFGHALRIALPETAEEHVPPATKNDSKDPTGPNAIPEGTWVRFKPGSTAAEHDITRPLAVAFYNTGVKRGFYVSDSSGVPDFYMGGVWTLFSPYCDSTINPLAGATFNGLNEFLDEDTTEAQRKRYTDPDLDAFTGELNGAEGILQEMPWSTIELLAPRSS